MVRAALLKRVRHEFESRVLRHIFLTAVEVQIDRIHLGLQPMHRQLDQRSRKRKTSLGGFRVSNPVHLGGHPCTSVGARRAGEKS